MLSNVQSSNEKINIEQLIQHNIDLSLHNTMHIRTFASFGAYCSNSQELRAAFDYAGQNELPITILGGGSNSVISGKGIPGLTIFTSHLTGCHINGELLCVSSGLYLDKTIDVASEAGLAGLEALGGIPGTVGGAIWGNAGANGVQISDSLFYVDYMTFDGKLHRQRTRPDEFSYRHSPFSEQKDVIIIEAGFRLRPVKQTAQLRIIKEGAKNQRKNGHQFEAPSCGCIFKNPQGGYAGELVEQAGLKGYAINGASVSKRHANFIVSNEGKATADDVRSLAFYMQKTVQEKFGITLEFEVQFLGQW
ncbi:MAG: UDP-N-acetylmuramate dehydrogenase [Sphaerochaetaceae bacterium]